MSTGSLTRRRRAQVLLLTFWCAEAAESTDQLKKVSQIAACFEDLQMPHIHMTAVKALTQDKRYMEALDISIQQNFLAEAAMIREMCAIELSKVGMHSDARTYRLANRMSMKMSDEEQAPAPNGNPVIE